MFLDFVIELVGITGRMTIDIVNGVHFYEFEYTLNGSSD
jgi:hypothetical protein